MTENELYDEFWQDQHLPDDYKEMMRKPLTDTLAFKAYAIGRRLRGLCKEYEQIFKRPI